ncbi:hypothetical protein ACWGJ9_11950 [Curtobacterium citreum]
MSILNLSKRRAPSPVHEHVVPARSGLSFDPLVVASAVIVTAFVLVATIAAFAYFTHTAGTTPTHHLQCVDNAGNPADSSACSRRDIPFIPAPVIVP